MNSCNSTEELFLAVPVLVFLAWVAWMLIYCEVFKRLTWPHASAIQFRVNRRGAWNAFFKWGGMWHRYTYNDDNYLDANSLERVECEVKYHLKHLKATRAARKLPHKTVTLVREPHA
jgi:hypothetical protein